MNEIVSIPKSLREQLSEAQRCLTSSQKWANDGYDHMARRKASEAKKILSIVAQQSPELAALVLTLNQGYRGIEIINQEMRTVEYIVDRKFLGINVGHDVVPVTSTVTTRKTVRFY